jgi:hypothetical protein
MCDGGVRCRMQRDKRTCRPLLTPANHYRPHVIVPFPTIHVLSRLASRVINLLQSCSIVLLLDLDSSLFFFNFLFIYAHINNCLIDAMAYLFSWPIFLFIFILLENYRIYWGDFIKC